MRRVLRMVLVAAATSLAGLADAATWSGVVTSISNVRYMPGTFTFGLDVGMPPNQCAGAYGAFWYGTGFTADNVKAAYAAVLAALLGGQRITVTYDPNVPACTVLDIAISK